MTTSLTEYELLLPQSFNDGTPVPPGLRKRAEQLMLDRCNGFTVVRGLEGAWRGADGRCFRDRSDGYRLATADQSSLLSLAVELGMLLGQYAVYVRCPDGKAMVLPVEVAPVAPVPSVRVFRYVLPKEAVANLLRLPANHGRGGELVLRYAYFLEELRCVQIVLADEPLPRGLTRTPGGIAAVGATGTRAEVRAGDETEPRRVEEFLGPKLDRFQFERKEQSS